jgi:hypothetical protein
LKKTLARENGRELQEAGEPSKHDTGEDKRDRGGRKLLRLL